MQKIESLIDDIIHREGGYVNHPADRGGPTKFGITASTLGAYRKLNRPAIAGEVQELHLNEAKEIYRKQYVISPRFNEIVDETLQEAVVDFGVHSGPGRAARILQSLVGVRVDGTVGPITLFAVNQQEPKYLTMKLHLARAIFLMRFIGRNPSQAAFARGWGNRLAELAEIE